ncbi:MAG: hypothetical protein E6780_03690 [Staphylococcus epidermidis]|nr:hypothetical protein [Staphylococcus epidermidis]
MKLEETKRGIDFSSRKDRTVKTTMELDPELFKMKYLNIWVEGDEHENQKSSEYKQS